jgi:pyridoxine/pyridoxamine 5'-phosphate oxidase
VDRSFYFGTDRGSRKSRNLDGNSAVVVHLESGDDVVIVEGTAAEIRNTAQLAVVNEAYLAKYSMKLTDAPGALVIYRVRPSVVFAWQERDFPASATRWLIGPA